MSGDGIRICRPLVFAKHVVAHGDAGFACDTLTDFLKIRTRHIGMTAKRVRPYQGAAFVVNISVTRLVGGVALVLHFQHLLPSPLAHMMGSVGHTALVSTRFCAAHSGKGGTCRRRVVMAKNVFRLLDSPVPPCLGG